ncbi:MAG TPA: sigma-54 dependent transcriptional regulator [Kofleriaceae bacterium]|nr:sigma-54 dependent transcriptional regulator [Kofleriaceae bacterium]
MSGARGQRRVLVVEDDVEMARMLERQLDHEGYDVEIAHEATGLLDRLGLGISDWEVVLLDVGLPTMSGVELLKIFRQRGSLAAIVMLTGDDSAATATTCMRAGAFHYLIKPIEPRELSIVVESAARHSTVRRRMLEGPATTPTATSLVGASAAMRKLAAAIEQVAVHDVSVLLRGESGTGKEVVARALHERSPRRGQPFVAVNCSAIPETLIDSELFGHTRGAFTGATADRPGVFVEADRGTLFLDEIGDMPMHVQARLLRVLQESEVRSIGASGSRKIDVRVIAATNVDLEAAIAQQRFRQDLFYRLHVVTLELPPLRERRDDIPLLAAHFLHKHGGGSPPQFTPEALDAIAAFDWPGNVRELENAVLHALAFQREGTIAIDALPAYLNVRASGTVPLPRVPEVIVDELLPLTEAKRRVNATFERAYLIKVLEIGNGSISEAARIAGIDRTNLRRLLKRHEIEPDDYRRRRD